MKKSHDDKRNQIVKQKELKQKLLLFNNLRKNLGLVQKNKVDELKTRKMLLKRLKNSIKNHSIKVAEKKQVYRNLDKWHNIKICISAFKRWRLLKWYKKL